jgi:hypothetical protein
MTYRATVAAHYCHPFVPWSVIAQDFMLEFTP